MSKTLDAFESDSNTLAEIKRASPDEFNSIESIKSRLEKLAKKYYREFLDSSR